MSQQTTLTTPNPASVLGKAVMRAADALGLSRADLSQAIGRDRSSLSRSGVDPQSKSGELSLLLVRCYRSLAVLVDTESEQMKHWFHTANQHTGGVPAEQVMSIDGLVRVTTYLDAIRAKL